MLTPPPETYLFVYSINTYVRLYVCFIFSGGGATMAYARVLRKSTNRGMIFGQSAMFCDSLLQFWNCPVFSEYEIHITYTRICAWSIRWRMCASCESPLIVV